ncbi:DUF4371 domain-containing protein [Trichonephila clavipes]|nr:DUF4371 domain-containing protein [Trichonephila clavipes]
MSDINDTAQLAIFIRGVDSQMNITEEQLELVSLKGATTRRYIKDAIIDCVQSPQIDLKNLVGIATDGVTSMNLCAQVLNMSHVMKVVVKVINSIKNNPLNHHQFLEYLREQESEYGDFIITQKFGG